MATLPGIIAALLPSVACPACWPAYAGILSAVGLGAFMNGPYFFALIVVLLGVTLLSLGYGARSRRGYRPLIVGAVAAIVIVIAKSLEGPLLANYAGVALLVSASVWNSWPMNKPIGNATKACGSVCGCSEPESASPDS